MYAQFALLADEWWITEAGKRFGGVWTTNAVRLSLFGPPMQYGAFDSPYHLIFCPASTRHCSQQ